LQEKQLLYGIVRLPAIGIRIPYCMSNGEVC
jgi:hypothetical protein